MDFIKEKLNKVNLKRFLYFGSVVVITFILNDEFVSEILSTAGPYSLAISLTLLVTLLWFIAGLVIFRALFEVGASFTLMIFIADRFCAIESVPTQNLDALKSLFLFGMGFVVVRFFNALWIQLFGNKKAKKPVYGIFNDPENLPPKGMITLSGITIGLFLWQLYLVFSPIVSNTCVIPL